jgi:membrane protein
MVSIERVFNGIWRARRPRSVVQRLVIYWTTITIGPLLIGASLSLTSWLVTQSMHSVSAVRGVQEMVLKGLPILLNGAAFGLLYLMIPNRRVLIKDAFVGGMTAAVGFEVMKRGFGVYVLLFPTYDLIYGTFATIPIFLLWMYLSWLVVLFGAVVVASLPQWRLGARGSEAGSGGPLFRALQLIELLEQARSQSQTPTVAQLASRSGIVEEEVEQLLETMNGPGWTRRVEPAGWVLARDLATLRLRDVYRLFAVRADLAPAGETPIVRAASDLLLQLEERLDVPLDTLLVERALSGAAPSSSPPLRVES